MRQIKLFRNFSNKLQLRPKKYTWKWTDNLSRIFGTILPLRTKILEDMTDRLSRIVGKELPVRFKKVLWRWDRLSVSKGQQETDTARCTITQKSAVLLSIIYVQVKYNNLINILTILSLKNFHFFAHCCYDIKQTTPLEQPVNTASSAFL